MDYLNLFLSVAPMVVMIASAVAAVTPTPKDDAALKWIKKVINVLALNVKNAKPAENETPK